MKVIFKLIYFLNLFKNLDSSILIILLCYFYFVHKHWDYFTQDFVCFGQLIFSNLNVAIIVFWSLIFVQGQLLASIVLVSEMLVWHIRLWQLQHQIECYKKRVTACPKILYIARSFKKLAIYIFKIAPMFGNLFLVYIAASMPFNGFFTIDILIGKKDRFAMNLFKYAFLAQQIFGLLIVHFTIATNNSKLSKSIYQIMQIPFHHQISKMKKIRLNLFIEDFYTNSKIGVRYGMLGLITLFAFTKVRFYLKFIFSLKLNFLLFIVCIVLWRIHYVFL